MYYNTAKNSLIEISGNVSLFWNQVIALLEVQTTSIKTMTANSGTGIYDELSIEADLGARLHTSEIRYHFGSDVSNNMVASGISFQYKNEDFQNYTTLSTFFDQDYYYTNTSGTLFAPRYVKLTHDLSKTDGFLTTLSGYTTGELYGFEILNDDTYVNFGSDGTVVGDTITVAREDSVDIREVQIYNGGLNKSTAYVSLDPTYTDLDKAMGVSLTENGPWVYSLDEEFSIVRAGENDNYGVHSNTELKNGVISMAGYSDAYDNLAFAVENGSYTTKVFSDNNTTWNSIIVDRVLPLNGFLKVDCDDGVETVEVRSSNYKPKSYHIYRNMFYTQVGNWYYLKYRDTWVETDEVVAEYDTGINWSTYGWENYFIVIDSITERFAGFVYQKNRHWCIINISGDTVKTMALSSHTTAMSFDWKDIKFDYEGGIWVYFYAVSYSSSDFVDESGHYLCYFDKDMNEKFKYFNITDFVGAMGVAYTTKYLWYTLPDSNQIQKIDYDGTVLYNHFENTDVLGGLCVLSDGSVWYANYKGLYKIKSNGIVEEEITEVADNLFLQIAPDGDGSEALWVLENFYISRIIISGENKGKKEFSVYINFATKLYPVNNGVWVKSVDVGGVGDSYMRYISKVNKRVENEYKLDYDSTPGILEHTYEDKFYASKMPLSIDTDWSNLEWKKVNIESFVLPEDNYHQVKITFRRQTPYQKYGDSVDLDSVFHTDDDFNQSSTDPNVVVWGDFYGGQRVYIENNELVMINDPIGDFNSYINTKNKYVLTGDFDVQFDYIMGDGTQTNKDENIYLYAYATDDGVWGQYLMSRIYVRELLSSTSYIYYYVNSSYSYTSLGTNYDRWIGKLRLKRSGNNIYGYVWDPQASSWKGGYKTGVNVIGNYFYLQIQTDRNGSDIYIDNFTVNAGTPYYYTGSPEVKGIYTRKEIEVKDIYPNSSKSVYLKSYVLQDLNLEDHYDTTLRAKWRTPIN